MKVLLAAPRYFPYIGGVEYVVKSIAERLAKMGHEVIVLAGESNAEHIKEEYINGVNVIRWPTYSPRDAYHIPKIRDKLRSVLKELIKEVDIVHVHSAHAVLPVYVGIKVKELDHDIKLVFSPHYHAHGHTLIRDLAWRILWRRCVGRLIRHTNKIHVVSILEAERLVNHYPEARDKLIIIPNGVEEGVFRYEWKGQNSNYVMYAGRIEKYKRLEVAVDLVTELNRYGYYLKLLIVGNGSYLPKLKQYAQKKAPNRVEFKSPLPRKEYLEVISNAFATINPSYHEAFSIFIAESLAIGTPAIVSQIIARIYGQRESEISPYLAKLLPILSKYKFTFLTNNGQRRITTWNEIAKRILYNVYQ